MAGIADNIYTKMPVLVQHAMVSGYGLYWNRRRFGRYYQAAQLAIEQEKVISSEEWQTYTQQKLREILLLAYKRVPHYKALWKGIVTYHQLEKFTVQDMSSFTTSRKVRRP